MSARSYNSATDYIRRVGCNLPNFATGTIAFWYKPNWNAGDSVARCLFFFGATTPIAIDAFPYSDNNFYIGMEGGAGGDQRVIVSTSGLFKSGAWALHLYTWNVPAGVCQYFQNDRFIGQHSYVRQEFSSPNLCIGNLDPGVAGGGGIGVGGTIDHFSQWDCVLTPSERARLNNGESPESIRREMLRLYVRGTGSSPELDAISGQALTVNGAAIADGYPVFVRARKNWIFRGTSPPPPPSVGAFKLVGGHNRLAGRGGLAA